MTIGTPRCEAWSRSVCIAGILSLLFISGGCGARSIGQQARVDGGTSDQDAEVVWVDDGSVARADAMPDDAALVGCGNGVAEAGEACDGEDLRGQVCAGFGLYEGELACREDCGAVLLEGCAGWCGDGAVNGPEVCDASDLGGMGCEGFGFYDGELLCSPGCDEVVLQGCYGYCGDGERNGPEECEGEDLGGMGCAGLGVGFVGGELLCDAECRFDWGLCHRCGDGECGQGEDAQGCPVDCAAVDLSVGSLHACTVRVDGSVLCWGKNSHGELGNGTWHPSPAPVRVVGLAVARQVSAGGMFSCAALTDGTASCWGSNFSGSLGDGSGSVRSNTPVAVAGLSGVIQVSAGFDHACAVLASGEVWCWGGNRNGQVGDGTRDDRRAPVPVLGITGAVGVDAAFVHTCAVLQGGTVQCWGRGTPDDILLPQELPGLQDATEIVIRGGGSGCARSAGGQVYCWGFNFFGQVGTGMPLNSYVPPTAVPGVSDAIGIAVGESHSCAARGSGGLTCWGSDWSGQLGVGTHPFEPLPVESSMGGEVRRVAAGGSTTCGLLADGTIRCIGSNEHGQLGADPAWATRLAAQQVLGLADARDIALGDAHTCAVLGDGSAWCWGQSWRYQLGHGSAGVHETVPVQVVGGGSFVAVDAGPNRSCAFDSGGSTWCWGTGYPIGVGTSWPVAEAPSIQSGFGPAESYCAGSGHDCAILAGGALLCRGSNSDGQVGDGTTVSRLVPTEITALSGVVQVACGHSHTCAIDGAGTVFCWGSNGMGQLGNGGTISSATPTAVAGLAPAVSVSAGESYTLAATSSGEVYHWGRTIQYESNLYPAYGEQTVLPELVPGLSDVVEVASGDLHACARGSSGEVRCWGQSNYGELGTGSYIALPMSPVLGITDARRIFTHFSASHTCALLGDGTAWCWGRNFHGQLGQGDPTTSHVPVEPDGL